MSEPIEIVVVYDNGDVERWTGEAAAEIRLRMAQIGTRVESGYARTSGVPLGPRQVEQECDGGGK